MLDPLAAIRKWESGGGKDPAGANIYNYKYNLNPSYYSASGYYQITNTTWRGVPSSITQGYPTAISAPYDVQTNAAAYLYNKRGFADWAPFNSNLSADIAAQGGSSAYVAPGSYSPSFDSGGSGSGDPYSGSSYTDFSPDNPAGSFSGSGVSDNFNPASPTDLHLSPDLQVFTGGPEDLQLSPDLRPFSSSSGDSIDYSNTPFSSIPGNVTGLGGLAGILGSAGGDQAASQWWNTAVGITGDWIIRIGLILLALVLIGAAAFALAKSERIV